MADTWTPISGYTPQDYTDTMVFEMSSETKKVETIMGQALVAGEENAQYIKFVLDRYWDGIDISGKTFSIEYALAGKYYGTSNAVNAEMSEDKVRFGWIVPVTACCVSGTLFFVLKVENTDYILKSQIVEVPVYKTIDVGDVVPEPTKEQWYREFASRVETAITEAETALSTAQAAQASAEAAAQNAQTSENNAEAAAAEAQIRYGSPLTASEAAMMVEENRVYVYTGSESGYTFGNWYYYDGSAWVSGGVYNGTGINTDTTLTQSGMAADAKATGDKISQIKEDFTDMVNSAYVTDSASGSVAHFVDGADDVPMKSVVINTESASATVTRTGKNLLKPQTVSTSVHNGISFTYMSDGGIVCNGTSTAVAYSSAQNGFRLQTGQYIKNTQSSDGIGVIVQTKTSPNWTTVQGGEVSDRTVTISAEDTLYDLAVRIRIPSGITLNNYVYYPMLRFASDADDTYEPYTGETYEVTLVDGVVQEEIKTLLGVNNIWSDAGDVDVEYRADTKLYIDKKLGV